MSTFIVESLVDFGNNIIYRLLTKQNSNYHISIIKSIKYLISTTRFSYYYVFTGIIFLLYNIILLNIYIIKLIKLIIILIIYNNNNNININKHILLFLISIYTFNIKPILSQEINKYEHDTGPNATDIWRSITNFIPIQQTSYGNITIGSIMSTEFDFIWWGRTSDQRIGYAENFFRVGFDASINTQCTGETSSYPSFWLKNNNDTVYVSVSTGTACNTQYSLETYGLIIKGISYHFKIYFNDTFLIIDITGGNRPNYKQIWPRQPTQSTFLGQEAPIWFMSNTFYSQKYNRGNGTFSNIIIISGQFTASPTIAPSLTPSITPSNTPSLTPSITPSFIPSLTPTFIPSNTPSLTPTNTPSFIPSISPSITPTESTNMPTNNPTKHPIITPTISPTITTNIPTDNPSKYPTNTPTNIPSITTNTPTNIPSNIPTYNTQNPSIINTKYPSISPTEIPTNRGDIRAEIILRKGSFLGYCKFECWECLQTIDIISNNNEYKLIFQSINETNCDCPIQNGIINNNQMNIGNNIENNYFFKMEKTINNYNDINIEYLLKINIIKWDNKIQNCSVFYFVNKDEFFGIHSQNILTIRFIICNVSNDLLTDNKMRETEMEYTIDFALLFDINKTAVNVTINRGLYCINDDTSTTTTTKSSELIHGNDEQVTVVIIFSDTIDAISAGNHACNEIEYELDIEIENCKVEISSENNINNNENNNNMNGLALVEWIMIICGIVFALILMLCVIYCYLSYKKRKEKKVLDMKYRKRTMSGLQGDTRGSVVTRTGIVGEGHSNQNSDQIDIANDNKPKLHIANESIKMDGNINIDATPGGDFNVNIKKEIELTDNNNKSKNKYESLKSYTNTLTLTNTNESIKHISLHGHYSHESQEMDNAIEITPNSIKPINNIINTDNGNGTPYTLVPNDENNNNNNQTYFNYDTNKYKNEHDMIEDVIQNKKANEIKNNDLEINEQIGKGQFGNVFKAKWEGNIVVIKQLNSINQTPQNIQDNTTDNTSIEDNNNVNIDPGEYEDAESKITDNENINYEQDIIKKENTINRNENDNKNFEKKKEERLKEMKGEIILASSLPQHNNLVEIFGYVESPQFGVVMSWMPGGSVEKYVYRKYKSDTDKIPTIIELLIILLKAASGIKHLHIYGLIHRDIACRNILLGKIGNNGIDSSTEVRISDFGLTRELENVQKQNDNISEQKTKSNFGPLKWMSPESIRDKKYSKKSDVYMFGITMWEIFYGMEPYINMLPIQVAMIVVNKGVRPPILHDRNEYRYTDMPYKYKILMETCWTQKPIKRPNFEEIIQILNEIQNNPLQFEEYYE